MCTLPRSNQFRRFALAALALLCTSIRLAAQVTDLTLGVPINDSVSGPEQVRYYGISQGGGVPLLAFFRETATLSCDAGNYEVTCE